MRLDGKVFKYAGPPGTGKSTTLLNVVERYLAGGAAPDEICYTTFTRAGAYEARDRACTRFKLSTKQLPYFRTLHSLCFQELDKAEVMEPGDWLTLARSLGIFFSFKDRYTGEEGVPRGSTKGDVLMSLWSLARVRMVPLEQVFKDRELHELSYPSVTLDELVHFAGTVNEYKKSTGKIDYTDMLEKWLSDERPFHCRYLIIDEAQDLSALQWKVVEKLNEHAKETHIAGDDDQCIHEWNGACPRHFIELEADEYTVLPQSYRIPAKVHALAQRTIQQVGKRLQKTFAPRTETGLVARVADFAQLDMSEGSWLVLARNNIFLDDMASYVRFKGLLYSGHDSSDTVGIYAAIRTWKILTEKKEPRPADECRQMYAFMSQRDRIVRGFKTKLAQVDNFKPLTYDDLKKDYGLVTDAKHHWSVALDMIPEDIRNWLVVAEKKEPLTSGRPRIELSTIHGAKGREADHVLLCPDMTFKTWNAFQNLPDAEHRVWYVGITRAKKSLHILQPTRQQHYPL